MVAASRFVVRNLSSRARNHVRQAAILGKDGIRFKRLFVRNTLDKEARNSQCIFLMTMVSAKKALFCHLPVGN